MNATEDLVPYVGVRQATRALGTSHATLYRRRRPPVACRPAHRPAAANRLAPQEREAALALLHAPEHVDHSPWVLFAHLLDMGRYVCSVRTFYRLLLAHGEVRERRDQLRHQRHAVPRLEAQRPNQVWTWDITKVRGPQPGELYFLYVVLDLFSRYVVGWMLARQESARLAVELFKETAARQGILPGELTTHADRGSSMRSRPLADILGDLGIARSFSRPHVPDDNPFSESQFKTFKYQPDFPERFGSFEDAHGHSTRFFGWYNTEHRHSGLGYLTPADVHFGRAAAVLTKRQDVLQAAYAAHPTRFARGVARELALPGTVWINQPTQAVALC